MEDIMTSTSGLRMCPHEQTHPHTQLKHKNYNTKRESKSPELARGPKSALRNPSGSHFFWSLKSNSHIIVIQTWTITSQGLDIGKWLSVNLICNHLLKDPTINTSLS